MPVCFVTAPFKTNAALTEVALEAELATLGDAYA